MLAVVKQRSETPWWARGFLLATGALVVASVVLATTRAPAGQPHLSGSGVFLIGQGLVYLLACALLAYPRDERPEQPSTVIKAGTVSGYGLMGMGFWVLA